MNQIGKKVVAFMLALTMIGSFPTLTAYATETEPVTTEEQEVETSNVDADNDSGLREISTPETADSGLNDDNDFQNLDADTFSEEAVEENSVSMMTAEDSEPLILSSAQQSASNPQDYTIYRNLDFEKADGLGYTWRFPYRSPDNTWLNQSQNGKNGSHALTVTQNTTSQKYFDVGELQNANNGTIVSGQDLILEQDVYLEESHPDMLLFYLGDNKTVSGVDKKATLVEIVGETLKYSDQTAQLSKNEWHRVSAAVHFSTHTYEIYLDGKLVFSNLSFNSEVNLLCYWRTLIYNTSPLNSVVHFDNMRIYDGTKPRMIDGEKNIYKNLDFSNERNWGINWQQPSGNEIAWNKDADGNGYLRFNKCKANAQMLMDINGVTLASKHIVYEVDVRPEDSNFAGALFWLREDVGSTQVTATLVELVSGDLKYGETRVPLNIGEWNHVSVVVDYINSWYDIYLNGTPLDAFQNMGLRTDMQSPSIWRVLGYNWSPNGAIDIDNMRIYDGTEPRDLESTKPAEKDIFSDEKALAFLQGKAALQPYSGTLYYNSVKQNVKESVQIVGDDVLVTADVFSKLFGQTINENGNTVTAGSAVFTIGSNTVQIDGESITTAAVPKRENGQIWLPVDVYGKNAVAQGCYYNDQHGMFVVSQSAFDASANPTKEANLYLFFDRKSPEELKNLLLANTNNDLSTHPRLLANANDFETLRSEVQTNSYKSAWFADIQRRADDLLEKDPLTYVISNGRLLDVANSALSRMEVLGMSWQITGERKYADRLIRELDAVSQFADWHPEHTLDTGTMAMATALAYDWGYDAMTEEQRMVFADRLYNLGLKTAHAAYYGTADYPTWWTNTETNWGVVVNAGFLNLAIAIAEKNPEYAMDVVAKAKRGMEATIYRIAPDGAWYEGPGYWSYLFQSLSYEMAGFESAFGERDDVVKFKGMDGFAQYQMYFSDPGHDVNNFHDSDEGPIGCFGMMYLAKMFNQFALMNYRAEFIADQNQTPTVYDLLWYDVDAQNSSTAENLSLDRYYRETELVTMRQDWNDENALWVSVHGGSINTAHDHIDAGTFVMNLGGVRWAIDLPKEAYSYVPDDQNPAIKAGLNSYYFYRRKGEGHNIVVINPDNGLEMDQAKTAKVVKSEFGTGRSYAVIDLSDVYNKNVNKYLRGYLVSNGRSALTVRDEIDLKNENSELYWFMHTEGQVVIEDNHTAYILQDGKQLKLQFETDASESELTVMSAEKLPTSATFEESKNIGIQKISLKLKASGKVNITVAMSLVGEEASNTAPETTAIAEWTTAGDENILPAAQGCAKRLREIKINGAALENFDPNVFHYIYSLALNETEANISVQADSATEIISHTMLNGHELKEIRVYDVGRNRNVRYTTYTIEIEPYSPYSPSQYIRYAVDGVNASSFQTDTTPQNVPEHSCDGNLSTRWSAEGVGQWLVHDLGESKKIDAFGVAEWMGNQRNFYFDLQVSDDGENWMSVVDNYATSGTTEDIEIIPLANSVNARYVRYWGKGNSRNGWNNVLELATYARRQHIATTPSPNPGATPNPDITPGTSEGSSTPINSSVDATSNANRMPAYSQNQKKTSLTIPRTADEMVNPYMLLALMAGSLTVMGCMAYGYRKKKK